MATILIAEDELLIRLAAQSVLEDAGHTVLEAGDGMRAVDLFYDHLSEIDLVLLDIQMPVLNGHEVLEKLRFVQQDIKVLFFTAVVMAWEEYGIDGIIQKPYSSHELLRKVEEVLG